MKKLFILLCLALTTGIVSAQTAMEALRYSMLYSGGTARSMAIGGAFGAIGADFSTLSTNPAGIGLYRSSEFTITPSLNNTNILSKYNGTALEDNKYNFNLSNAGMVLSFDNSSNTLSKWKFIHFGLGVNKLANFNSNTMIEGYNSWNSIITEYQTKAQGIHPDKLNDFDTKMAWNTYLLLDTMRDGNGNLAYSSVIPNGGVTQAKYIQSTGALNEYVITVGGNFDDKLYLGGTIGIPYIRYIEHATYEEFDDKDSIPIFNQMSIYDELLTTGTGVNFKFGMIYRPTDWLRVGGAFHTPTFYTMHDEYYREISHTTDNNTNYEEKSPRGVYDYSLTTPMRAIGNLAFIYNQIGLIGIEYEFVDYSEAGFSAPGESFGDIAREIKDKYTQAHNIRVGGELNLHPIQIRAGYGMYGSPYQKNINDLERTNMSFGIGLKDQNYFLDFAYSLTSYKEDYYLYNPALVNAVKMDKKLHSFLVTLGFKF